MQALLDVAACSVIMLGPPFVVGLEDSPFISFSVFVVPLVSMHFHPYRIWNDIHSTNGIPFYILGKLLGAFFFFLEVVLFLAVCTGMQHCFFIWPAFQQLKHLALAAFCTLKVSSVATFVLWDIDLISL